MQEIEIGEYVRSSLGSIGKITRIEDEIFLYEDNTLITLIGKVVKHSKNIIDLIQVGDYVNGKKINDKLNLKYVHESIIKSIVTKEQFESIEYKI